MIGSIIRKYLETEYRSVNRFINKPFETQDKILKYLLSHGSNTLIGTQFGFNSIKNKDEYRKNIPVFHYEDLRPYIDKIIINKQTKVLWDKPIKWFAMSSGTTEDKSKYIPVTKESLVEGHYKCGKQLLSIYMHSKPDAKFLLGKTLLLGGSKQVNSIGNNIYTGDISAILIKNLYFWAKWSRTPEKIALIRDWETKLEILSDYAQKQDIRALMGVPSWLLVLLKKIKKDTGKELTELWPNLEVFFHGGVKFDPFEQQYKKLFPKESMTYWETYNASEGFFGVQYSNKSKEMLLMLDNNIYYEFAPAGEWDLKYPQTLTLDEVEIGKSYALIISTNGGLWRYMIGDTIEFTSLKPFLFKITGRTKSYVNAFGEEVIVDNAEQALNYACQNTGAEISEYTAAPIYFGDNNVGAHEWLIEFEREPSDINLFVEKLDEGLKKINSDYEAKRSYNLSLQKPIVKILQKNSFFNWLESKGKVGGQNKVPRLANNRDYVDSILQYVQQQKQ